METTSMQAAVRKRAPRARSYDEPVVLRLQPAVDLTEDQFFALCQLNRDLRLERNAEGEVLIMAPVGFDTNDRESEILMQLRQWAKQDGTGVASGPSGGFRLANGAVRAPDASWVPHAR